MKSKKIIVYMLFAFCLFYAKNVYAETGYCEDYDNPEGLITSVELHDKEKTEYAPGEKVYVDIKGADRGNDVDISITLRNGSSGVLTFIKNVEGTNDDVGRAYFIIPDSFKDGDEVDVEHYTYYKFATSNKNDTDGRRCAYFNTFESTQFGKSDVYLSNANFKIKIVEKQDEDRNILKNITLDKNYGYNGGPLNYNISVSKPISTMVLSYFDQNTANSFIVQLTSEDKTATELSIASKIPSYVIPGNYKVIGIDIYDTDYRRYGYTINKSFAETSGILYLDKDITLMVGEKISDMVTNANFEIKKLELQDTKTTVGEKVPVSFDFYYNDVNLRMKSVMLNFYDKTNNKMFSAYLKTLDKDSYIIVPSNAELGDYVLQSSVVTFESYVGETNTIILNATSQNGDYENMFNQPLNVSEKNGETALYFYTEKLDFDAFTKIEKADDNAIVTIHANGNSVVPADVFEALKDSTKQLVIEYNKSEWVFNGTDIAIVKPIDASVSYISLKDSNVSDVIKEKLDDNSIVVEFPDNGTLPGKVLIRIKDEDVYNKLTGERYYVYHIDEENNKLNRVAIELQKSYDGYVEFYINHNSKYVISSKEINDTEVTGDDDEMLRTNTIDNEIDNNTQTKKTKEDEKDNNNLLLYVISGACCVLVIGILVLLLLKKKANKKVTKVEEELEQVKKENKTE